MEVSINNIPQVIRITYKHDSVEDYCFGLVFELRIINSFSTDGKIQWCAAYYPIEDNNINTVLPPLVPHNNENECMYLIEIGNDPNDACQNLIEKLNETTNSWEELKELPCVTEEKIPSPGMIRQVLKYAYEESLVDKDSMHNLKRESEEIFKKLLNERKD